LEIARRDVPSVKRQRGRAQGVWQGKCAKRRHAHDREQDETKGVETRVRPRRVREVHVT
jgi:hypothetical protein